MRIVRVTYPDLHGVAARQGRPDRRLRLDVASKRPRRSARRSRQSTFATTSSRASSTASVTSTCRRSSTRWRSCRGRPRWPGAWPTSRPTASPYGADPRAALKRAVARFEELGLRPGDGPGARVLPARAQRVGSRRLDALRREPDARLHRRRPCRPARRARSHAALDPRRRPRSDRRGARVRHEPVGDQPAHSAALDAADRAFRFKAAVKDLATREGLLATFMGKPFNGDAGSGFHLHLSLCGEDGAQRLRRRRRRARAARSSCGTSSPGVIAHAPALMAFLNPTVNAYRRIDPHELVPTRACWGYDNRFGLVRVPPERGAATRIEMRLADGSANPYLATAGAAVRRARRRPARADPAARRSPGLVYELPEEEQGDPIPLSLDAALDALEADADAARGDGPDARRDVPQHQALRARALPPSRLRLGSGGVRAPPLGRATARGRYQAASTSTLRTLAQSASVEKPSAWAASVAVWSRRVRTRASPQREIARRRAVGQEDDLEPRSWACRAVVSQHMWVMKPPIRGARRRAGEHRAQLGLRERARRCLTIDRLAPRRRDLGHRLDDRPVGARTRGAPGPPRGGCG